MKNYYPPYNRYRAAKPEALARPVSILCPDCGQAVEFHTYKSDEVIESMSHKARIQWVKAHGHRCQLHKKEEER